MRVTVETVNSHVVAESPGISAMHLEVSPETRLIVITCPACGERTMRYLVEGDEFDVRHLRECQLERAIASFIAKQPERVGRVYGLIAFPRDSR